MYHGVKNVISSTGTGKFEFEAGAVSRLRPEGRQRQTDNPRGAASRLRQASCGPKTSSGKPTAASRQPERERPLRRPSGANPCGNAPFGSTSSAQLSLNLNLNWVRGDPRGRSHHREATITLGARRPVRAKPQSGSHHLPGRAATRVAEANNRAAAIVPGARLTRGRSQHS